MPQKLSGLETTMAQLKAKAKNPQIIVGGLGRPFTLGMLYNAPKDELVPGLALWDSETLQSLTLQRPQRSSNFDISASDSTKDSSFNLNVDASLKLSFMSGLIEVGGSANYLKDQKEFNNQSRVILQYTATTLFEQLVLTEDVCEKIENSKINKLGLATHVVTGIEYGAHAFFVFDSQKLEASDVQTVKGQMNVVIKKIPECDIEGAAKVELTTEEKNLVQTFSVKFYGDFLLKSNPATFDTAVQTYVNLPKLLIDKETAPVNTVPVRVWMLPLEAFTTQPEQIIKGISVGLVIDAEDALEELSDIQMRCNDCLSVDAVGKFHQLQHQLHMFHTLCHHYTSELQRQMADTCPAIREGKADESVLRSVFDERRSSPFSQDKLTKWLENKEREVNVVESILEILTGVQVLSTKAQVDRVVLAPGDDIRFGYVFTSLETTDAQLEDMRRYLDSLKRGQDYEQLDRGAEVPWFNRNDVLTSMRGRAESTTTKGPDKTVFNFVTAIKSDFIGAATFIYQEGILVDEKGVPPQTTMTSHSK